MRETMANVVSKQRGFTVVKLGKFSLDAQCRRDENAVELSLPMPPSVNGMFVNGAHGGRFKSKGYDEWIKAAGWRLQAQKPGRIVGPYEVDAQFARSRASSRSDLDNRYKGLSDLLVKHGVISSDSLAEKITMRWVADGEGVYVTVTKARIISGDVR